MLFSGDAFELNFKNSALARQESKEKLVIVTFWEDLSHETVQTKRDFEQFE